MDHALMATVSRKALAAFPGLAELNELIERLNDCLQRPQSDVEIFFWQAGGDADGYRYVFPVFTTGSANDLSGYSVCLIAGPKGTLREASRLDGGSLPCQTYKAEPAGANWFMRSVSVVPHADVTETIGEIILAAFRLEDTVREAIASEAPQPVAAGA